MLRLPDNNQICCMLRVSPILRPNKSCDCRPARDTSLSAEAYGTAYLDKTHLILDSFFEGLTGQIALPEVN